MHATRILHRQPSFSARLAVLSTMLIAWAAAVSAHAQEQEKRSKAEIEKAQYSDLMVLSQTLKSYKVENLPVCKALEEIWIQATGKPPQTIITAWFAADSAPEPLISLNLKDVPAMDVIRYISELAPSRWKFRGRGDHLLLVMEHLTMEGDRIQAYVYTLRISTKAAKFLGLKAGISSSEAIKCLRSFGMVFDDSEYPAVAYNANDGTIAVIAPVGSGLGCDLKTLIILADRDQLLPHKP